MKLINYVISNQSRLGGQGNMEGLIMWDEIKLSRKVYDVSLLFICVVCCLFKRLEAALFPAIKTIKIYQNTEFTLYDHLIFNSP